MNRLHFKTTPRIYFIFKKFWAETGNITIFKMFFFALRGRFDIGKLQLTNFFRY